MFKKVIEYFISSEILFHYIKYAVFRKIAFVETLTLQTFFNFNSLRPILTKNDFMTLVPKKLNTK